MKNKKFWISAMALVMVVAMVLSLLLMIIPAGAKSSSEIQDELDAMYKENEKIEERLEELENLKWENRGEIKEIVSQRNAVEEQIGLLHAQISNMNSQIAAYNLLIAQKQEELTEAQSHLDALNEKYKERIRAMEEDGALSYWSVLFQANSFSDLLDRLNMVEEIAASDQRRLKEMQEAAREVAAAEEVLRAEQAELKKAQEELAQKQTQWNKKRAEAEELLQQLIAKGEEYEALRQEEEKALEDLEIDIGKMEVELDEAKYKEYLASLEIIQNIKPGSNAGAGVGGTIKTDANGIKWLVPCDYIKVSSAFGWRVHPVYKDWRHHNGVDFGAWCLMKEDGTTDSPIYASRSGVVIISKRSSSAGWYVTIDHLDGYRTTYMHMCCKPFVEEGDVVAAGQTLGCIGSTGTSTNDHLHFGVYYNGEPVNPMTYIG